MSEATIIARLVALEARVAELEAGGGGGGGASSGSTGGGGPTIDAVFPDSELEKEWAQKWAKKIIAKDPAQYDGPTQKGRSIGRASEKWLRCQASFCEWKARKGRELPDSDPKKWKHKTRIVNGEEKRVPWHEMDSLEAKFMRTLAARAAKKAQAQPAKTAPAGEPDAATGTDDDTGDCPF